MKKNRYMYFVAFLFLATGIGYLFYGAVNESKVYFLNVVEAKAQVAKSGNLAQARLFGIVSEANLQHTGSALTFSLMDKDDASLMIDVSYSGAVPDAFKAGAEVIVEGAMSPEGPFKANTLMTKCPSKYQKANRI